MIRLVDYLLTDDYSNKVAERSIVRVLEMRKFASDYKFYLKFMCINDRLGIKTNGHLIERYIKRDLNTIFNTLKMI